MRELILGHHSEDAVRDALYDLRSSEVPVVFRASPRATYGPAVWEELLTSFGFEPDLRQFDYELRLTESLWWEISNQPDKADSYAFSTTAQPLHNDNAWFPDPAEVNFFVMIRQAKKGGRQSIYRVSRLINDLASLDPKLLSDLQSHEVTVQKGSTPIARLGPIIQGDGRLAWNFYRTIRDSPETERLCERFFGFLEKQLESSSIEHLHAASGDAFAINDALVLHGREAFVATEPKERVLMQSMWNLVSPV